MEKIAKELDTPIDFTTLQYKTKLPKSTLSVRTKEMLENDIIKINEDGLYYRSYPMENFDFKILQSMRIEYLFFKKGKKAEKEKTCVHDLSERFAIEVIRKTEKSPRLRRFVAKLVAEGKFWDFESWDFKDY